MPTLLDIRKAFEVRLADTLAAYDIAVEVNWPDGQSFDDSALLIYCRPRLFQAAETPKTLGPNPRVQRRGLFKIQSFLKEGQPEDRLDDLAETLKEAYPYATDLVAGGASVQIENKTVLGQGAAPVDGWVYRSTDITWSIGI